MSLSLCAFVVGYTGRTGSAIVKWLAKDNRYSSVKLIGRRQVDDLDYGEDVPESAKSKFSQHVVDFNKLDEHVDLFKDTDVGFCALGTTRMTSGKELQRVIEYDYVLKVAELAHTGECKEFHVVTSKGANPESKFFYTRLKGEVEEALKSTYRFPNFLAIYRPGQIVTKQPRPTERFFTVLRVPVEWFAPLQYSVPVETLARAMTNAPFCLESMMREKNESISVDHDRKSYVIENEMLFELAAQLTETEQL